jgi:hypothetical protein
VCRLCEPTLHSFFPSITVNDDHNEELCGSCALLYLTDPDLADCRSCWMRGSPPYVPRTSSEKLVDYAMVCVATVVVSAYDIYQKVVAWKRS